MSRPIYTEEAMAEMRAALADEQAKRAAAERERDEYRETITWHTCCPMDARRLTQMRAAEERAEQAERELAKWDGTRVAALEAELAEAREETAAAERDAAVAIAAEKVTARELAEIRERARDALAWFGHDDLAGEAQAMRQAYRDSQRELAAVRNDLEQARAELAGTRDALPLADWCEEDGPVLWWLFPVSEPPYCGTPLDEFFPTYVTHWTRVIVPRIPTP